MGDRRSYEPTGPRVGPSTFPPTLLLQNCGWRGCHPAPEGPLFPSPAWQHQVPLSWGQRTGLSPQGEQGRRQRLGPLHSIDGDVTLGSGMELWGLVRKNRLMR